MSKTERDIGLELCEPKSQKQYDFVWSNTDITVFGGSAGSGKTWQGLVRFLQFINEPEYQGYVIRKTQASLKFGAFKTAIRLFTAWEPRVKINRVDMTFRFPSGAVIIFKGLDGAASIEYFQGQEISGALVDEATHIKYSEIEWLMTRLRTNAKIKPTVWFTCNPDPDHFIAEWVDYYLYPKKTYIKDEITGRSVDVGGRVDPEKNGRIRWYYLIEGIWHWDDDRDTLIEKCKGLIYDPNQKPMSFCFIGATCDDNPVLMAEQPDYKNRLLNKGRIEAERLAYGNWYIREEGAGFWKNEWCRKIKAFPAVGDDELPPDDVIDKRVRCWDLAWTEPHDANPDPDYTAGVLMFRTKKGYYVVEHVIRGRMRAGSVYRYIADVAKKDYDCYGIIPQYIPEDPAAGKATYQFAKEYLMQNGITAVNKVTGSKQNNKLERFKNFAAASENGAVLIMVADWNEDYFNELEVFDGTRNTRHDDMVDATSDAFNVLYLKRKIRKGVVGNMF